MGFFNKKNENTSIETNSVGSLGLILDEKNEENAELLALKPLPVIGHLPAKKQIKMLTFGLVGSMAVALIGAGIFASKDASYTKLSGDAFAFSSAANKLTTNLNYNVLLIKEQSANFEKVLTLQKNVIHIQQYMTNASLVKDIEATEDATKHRDLALKDLVGLGLEKSDVERNINAFYRVGMAMFKAYTERGQEAGDKLMEVFDASSLNIQNDVEKIVASRSAEKAKALASLGTSSNGVDSATLVGLTDEMLNLANEFKNTSSLSSKGAELEKIVNSIRADINTLQKNSANNETDQNPVIVTNVNEAVSVLSKDANDIIASVSDSKAKLKLLWAIVGLSLMLFVVMVVAMMKVFQYQMALAERSAAEMQKNQANQDSINQLLREMQYVSEGNLAARLSVENDFSGMIAIAINNTVESLQGIVKKIKETSSTVSFLTEEANSATLNLKDFSVKQGELVENTVVRIGNIAAEMDSVSQSAFMAQDSAERTKEVSAAGEAVVAQSIAKMNTMRETIQESSKKIKRLGESSQAIGEITGLIKDITKQINILALNAAIHAASTGEAGRAFAVVAHEVQRLADDSSEATKKIEEMIVNIQQDTAIAISTMEKATKDVVEGTQLSDQAGAALKEINKAAEDISIAIQEVSNQIEEKSGELVRLSLTGSEVKKISEKAEEEMDVTTSKMTDVKHAANELNVSVEKFKTN